MAKLSDIYESAYLKASDLNGKRLTVTIASAEVEKLGKSEDADTKLVLAFTGKKKKMVCNKTNAKTIAKLYGDETENWINQQIFIEPREVEFQGDMVWSIRVSLQKPAIATQRPVTVDPAVEAAAKAAQSAGFTPSASHEGNIDEDVPF